MKDKARTRTKLATFDHNLLILLKFLFTFDLFNITMGLNEKISTDIIHLFINYDYVFKPA